MIESSSTGFLRKYLAQIIKGPFFLPDAFGKDSAFAMASILQADKIKFRPEYHGVCHALLLGELENPDNYDEMKSPGIRPFPQAAVRGIDLADIERLLDLNGKMYLGELMGYRGVKVQLNNNKDILPRNLGIFGTVGSGKTNTSQVLIEEASKEGWAVIVLDVEGEYTQMDKPTKESGNKEYKNKMTRFGVEANGISHFKVYNCAGSEKSRSDSTEFGVNFADLDPVQLMSILEMSTPQEERFLGLYAQAKVRAKSAKKPKGVMAELVEKEQESMGITLDGLIDLLETQVSNPKVKGADKSSYLVLLRKFRKLQNTGVIDKGNPLNSSETIKTGQVSIVDLSNDFYPWVKNIVISDILGRIFKEKTRKKAEDLPRTLIVIEEAHSFVSRGKERHMAATLDILRDISRRGRKRWLGLCFISQQPAHLPPEIYELCNTKIIHKITGGKNLDAVKASAGDVDNAKLADIPMLAKGSALVICPQFRYPLMVDVRPCQSDRNFVD